jgi:hypothetical protein
MVTRLLASIVAIVVLACGRASVAKTFNLPKRTLTEAVAAACHFVEAQKIDVSHYVLASAEFKNLDNEYEPAFWEITWVQAETPIVVHVLQDGTCKLVPAKSGQSSN